MKFNQACFLLSDPKHGAIEVQWYDGTIEERPHVSVWIGGVEHKYDNGKRAWKPCLTHAKELIRKAIGKPPENEFAKQRRAKSEMKPLAVFK